MSVANRLEDWSLDIVEKLASHTSSENQDFEFKTAGILRDPNGKQWLSKQVSAFANPRGGCTLKGSSTFERKGHASESSLRGQIRHSRYCGQVA